MRQRWIACCGLLVASPASSEVVIERSPRPIAELRAEGLLPPAAEPVERGGLFATKGTTPSDSVWIIPRFFVDDSVSPPASTLWSVRNQRGDGMSVAVAIEYFDPDFSMLDEQNLLVLDEQLVTFNVAALGLAPGGQARGFIRFTPDERISVDVFQLDPANDFATGGTAVTIGEFCGAWQVRFLRFPGPGGTRLFFVLNGPRGADPADPPTVTGDVFSELGAFINSFVIRTDEWAMEIDAHDFVLGGEEFGTMRLGLETFVLPPGLVEVEHSAFGRFSVGHTANCLDP